MPASEMVNGEGGFWLVSQAARILNDFLRAVSFPGDKDIIDLWVNTPEQSGNNCRAFYRRSEKSIYIVWGRA